MGHGEYIITDCQESEDKTTYIIWAKMYAMFDMHDLSRFATNGYILEYIEPRQDGKPYIHSRFRVTVPTAITQ